MSVESEQTLLQSYIPEVDFWERKRVRGCRICLEDCAVLDARRDFSTVSYRGNLPAFDGDFLHSVGLSSSERNFLLTAISSHRRLLLRSSLGAILVFADHLSDTGLVPVIRPHLPPETTVDAHGASLLRALSLGGHTEFSISPSFASLSDRARAQDVQVLRTLDEIFYYVDGAMSEDRASIPLSSAILRFANFAGCDPKRITLPEAFPALSRQDERRLLDFLLCAFLTLRQKSGGASFSESDERVTLSLSIDLSSPIGLGANASATDATRSFPFLQCSCFEGAEASLSDDGTVLKTALELHPTPLTIASASLLHPLLLRVLCTVQA
ncbi:MAG: hypothetical protein IKB75_04710 [Clostridia bacterium]|nr:hypothetical protein [Clostridia bacterium]MBR2722061.1 hypothetical protein [Clostridia bacterium]